MHGADDGGHVVIRRLHTDAATVVGLVRVARRAGALRIGITAALDAILVQLAREAGDIDRPPTAGGS
ncbi:hypothetical protein AB0L97_32750 [Nocardia sp. NPDC051911]|uniref:hypothetical protein n=1 Tax=Nocardia sp. NPDC051911 TaxID=3154648 RepID=UPI00343A3548